MKKIFASLSLVFILSVAVFAQTPQPSPTVAPKADEDVVKISTTLIQIDVSVTDRKGNVVSNLKPEDFEIYENGKKQEITNFSFISSVREVNSAPSPPDR